MVRGRRQAGDVQQIGRWRVLGPVAPGSGTMVYRVADGRGVEAAIKTVRPGDRGVHKAVAVRLHQEAAMLRRAGTDGVVHLREDGSDAALPHLVLDLVRGPSVGELVARHGVLRAEQVAVVGSLVAATLARVHERGVVHGDVKPANVLCAGGGPVLIDFDAATVLGARPPRRGLTAADGRAAPAGDLTVPTALTSSGTAPASVVRMTPRWTSPERVAGRCVGAAADVFGLGALLVFLATGRAPFGEGSSAVLLERVVAEPARLVGVPPSLVPLIVACLAKRPGDRPSAADVAARLGVIPRRPAAARAA